MKILDLGCGTGNTLEAYTSDEKIGIDIDPENIEICKQKMPSGTWILGDISTISLEPYIPLDTIVCIEVLEHIQNWQAVLENLSQAQSGAKLLITVPFAPNEKKLLEKRPQYWKEIGHVNFFYGKEIADILQKTDWTNIRVQRTNAALFFELQRLFKKNAPCLRHTYYDNILSLPERIFWQLFRTDLFTTKLRYFFPLWIVTIPLGKILNLFFGGTIQITAEKK